MLMALDLLPSVGLRTRSSLELLLSFELDLLWVGLGTMSYSSSGLIVGVTKTFLSRDSL